MNIERILTVLKAEGFCAEYRGTSAGAEVGVLIRGSTTKFVVGLVPIDDESDMRFVDCLESQARKGVDKLKEEFIEER